MAGVSDTSGITDAVEAVLNPEGDQGPDPDAKGPGDEWDDPAARDEEPYETAEIKGPSEAQWSDDARATRGAERPPAPEQEDPDAEPAKGPDPDQWGDEARAARGAANTEE